MYNFTHTYWKQESEQMRSYKVSLASELMSHDVTYNEKSHTRDIVQIF